MFEYFFANRLLPRQRDDGLKAQSAGRPGGSDERRDGGRLAAEFGDTATSLPLEYIQRTINKPT